MEKSHHLILQNTKILTDYLHTLAWCIQTSNHIQRLTSNGPSTPKSGTMSPKKKRSEKKRQAKTTPINIKRKKSGEGYEPGTDDEICS